MGHGRALWNNLSSRQGSAGRRSRYGEPEQPDAWAARLEFRLSPKSLCSGSIGWPNFRSDQPAPGRTAVLLLYRRGGRPVREVEALERPGEAAI